MTTYEDPEKNFPARRDNDFSYHYTRADDEINLYELWNTLARRWYVIAGVLVATMAVAFVYALLRESEFQFRTSLDIGTLGTGDAEERLVESPSETRNRLREAIMPSVRAKLSEEFDSVPSVNLAGGEENSLIVMSSNGPRTNGEIITRVHDQIASRLREAHSRSIESRQEQLELRKENLEDELAYLKDERVLASRREKHEQGIADAESQIDSLKEELTKRREELQARISDQQRELDALADERKAIEAELGRAGDRGDLLEQRIETTESLLSDLQERRMELTRSAADDSVIALFLGTTELDQVRRRLDQLQDERQFQLPDEQEKLQNRIQEIKRTHASVNDEIKALRLELDNLNTRFERRIQEQRRTVRQHETELSLLEADNEQERRDTERQIREVEARSDEITPTQAGFVALRSIDSNGPGTSVILALSVVLGGMLGVVVALFMQFVEGARLQSRSGQDQQTIDKSG